jgi:hypothetical protein
MPRSVIVAPFVVGTLFFLAGCGGPRIAPVSGVVLLDGKAYPNAVVSFQPIGSEANPNPGRGSTGITDEQGRFTLTYDGSQNGAVVGMHRVRIFTKFGVKAPKSDKTESDPDEKVPAGGERIPAEWNELSTKEFEVPSGGTDKADFAIVTPKASK